jgi:hypothetical protein
MTIAEFCDSVMSKANTKCQKTIKDYFDGYLTEQDVRIQFLQHSQEMFVALNEVDVSTLQ